MEIKRGNHSGLGKFGLRGGVVVDRGSTVCNYVELAIFGYVRSL
jgi:hypothetical protein